MARFFSDDGEGGGGRSGTDQTIEEIKQSLTLVPDTALHRRISEIADQSAADQLRRTAGIVVTIVAVVASIIVGVGLLLLETTAEKVARDEVEAMSSEISRRVDAAVKEIDKNAESSTDSVMRTRAEVVNTLTQLTISATERLNQSIVYSEQGMQDRLDSARDSLRGTVDEAKVEVSRSVQRLEDFERRANTAINLIGTATQSVDRKLEEAREVENRIAEQVDEAGRVRREIDALIATLKRERAEMPGDPHPRASPRNGSDGDDEKDEAMDAVRGFQFLMNGDYRRAIDLVEDARRAGSAQLVRLYTVVPQSRPDQFETGDLMIAFDAIEAVLVDDPFALYSEIVEFLYAGVRGPEAVFQRAKAGVEGNILFAFSNEFEVFGIEAGNAVFAAGDPEARSAAIQAIHELDWDELFRGLRPRGLINLLSAAKAARLPVDIVLRIENAILDGAAAGEVFDIDDYLSSARYPSLSLIVEALTAEPISDRARIARFVDQRVMPNLAQSRGDDPWGAAARAREFVEQNLP